MVEIIPRPLAKSPRWINTLFYFSLVVFMAIIAGYFILVNSLERSQEKSSNLDKQIKEEETPENIALEKEVMQLDKKIKDFSLLINQHVISSNFFTSLEKLTYPKIWFSQVNLSSKEGKVLLTGHADSFLTLGYQLQVLFAEPLIKEVSLSQISIAKTGEVDFALSITVDPQMLKW